MLCTLLSPESQQPQPQLMVHGLQRSLVCGAAVTLTELVEACRGPAKAVPATWQPATKQAWGAVAAHLERVAGSHVRAAATLGGHFALCRCGVVWCGVVVD